jgi:hypothetical protein
MFAGGKLAPRSSHSPPMPSPRCRGTVPRFASEVPDRRGGGVGPDHPFSGEKLSPVLALYRADDFAAAARLADRCALPGAGHSIGLPSRAADRALELGLTLPVCR